jgi:glycosyltransferase involved in cell wall biosynthesis
MGVSCGRVLMSSVTIMIAVSEYVRERHLGQMDIAVGRVIPNFYDSGELPSAAPTQYELSPNVVFVGHPSFEKGFDVFVKLAALMQSSAVRFTAILPTPPFKDVLESHPTNLCLMIGIPRYQVLKTLQSASLVLVPSRIPDSCPTVVLEAMALGRVVVGSSVGGIPTLIRNGVTGYLVNPEDLEYQLQLVRDILADENRRITVGSCAKIEFSQKFDARIVVSKIAKVYQEVVSH